MLCVDPPLEGGGWPVWWRLALDAVDWWNGECVSRYYFVYEI